MHFSMYTILSLQLMLSGLALSLPSNLPTRDITEYDGNTPTNVTDLSAVGIDPSFRAVFAANKNLLPLIETAHLIIITAADIANSDLERPMSPQVFLEKKIAPSIVIQVVTESTSIPLQARHVLWGLGRALIDNLHQDSFGECIERLYLGNEHIGSITIWKPRIGNDGSNDEEMPQIQDISSPSSATSMSKRADDNKFNTTVVGQYDTNSTLTGDGLVVTHEYTSGIRIPLPDFFASAINAIVGLAEMDPFVPSRYIRYRHDGFHTDLSISPPNPPRIKPPFNSKYDSLRMIARVVTYMIDQNVYAEIKSDCYKDWIKVSTLTVKKWLPAS